MSRSRSLWQRFKSALGPGLVTGAADDDPAGIATYSLTGAKFGLAFLWTAVLTWPLMAAVQMMCARIGLVTGVGLTEALRQKWPRGLLIVFSLALFAANTLNVGANLSAMADAAKLLTGWDSRIFALLFGLLIASATVRWSFRQIADVLKWLTLALAGYVVTAFLLKPDWGAVWQAVTHPHIPGGREGWAVLVAILGTTISPYLFYWQSAQEVEEMKSAGKVRLSDRRGATAEEITDRAMDVGAGTFASNVIMFFIILTAALTLHKAGQTEFESSRQVAEALRPLAGNFATLLYTVCLVAVGMISIPTLAGSAAYALAETFGWRQGLNHPFRQAPQFYLVVVGAVLLGVGFDFVGVNPIKALFASAVLNGLLAPFVMIGILAVASDRKLMQGQPSSKLALAVVGLTTLAMCVAAVAMFVL